MLHILRSLLENFFSPEKEIIEKQIYFFYLVIIQLIITCVGDIQIISCYA